METFRIRYLDGWNAIRSIKLVREFTALGLADAKNVVEQAGVILERASAAEARRIAEQFIAIDAYVEVERTWKYLLAFDPGHPARGDQPLERLRVGERELELDHGELGSWSDSQTESFGDPDLVQRRVVAVLGDWHRRGLTVAENEIEMLAAVSAREAGLEARLCTEVDDPEAHLIYGDWLQSRGDPRGQLMALHEALESGSAIERPELQAKIQEHRSRHASHLFGSLRSIVAELEFGWRHGMVESVRLGPMPWSRLTGGAREILATLLALPIALRPRKLALTGFSLAPLANSSSATVEHLELRLHGLSRRHPRPVEAGRWPRLNSLTLDFVEGLPIDRGPLAALMRIPHFATVRELELRVAGPLPYPLVHMLSDMPELANLQRLDLSGCTADRRSIAMLVEASARGTLPRDLRPPSE